MATGAKRRSGNPAKRAGASTGFWHGGSPGRDVGEILTPSAVRERSRIQDLGASLLDSPYDPNMVYVAADRQIARAFAGGGWLYMVRPIGDVFPDPDFPFDPPPSYACREAEVVRVVERGVRMTEVDSVRTMARYKQWPDGSPMYDVEGYLTMNPTMMRRGVTLEMLRALGPWRNTFSILPELNRLIIEAGGVAAQELLRAHEAIAAGLPVPDL